MTVRFRNNCMFAFQFAFRSLTLPFHVRYYGLRIIWLLLLLHLLHIPVPFTFHYLTFQTSCVFHDFLLSVFLTQLPLHFISSIGIPAVISISFLRHSYDFPSISLRLFTRPRTNQEIRQCHCIFGLVLPE